MPVNCTVKVWHSDVVAFQSCRGIFSGGLKLIPKNSLFSFHKVKPPMQHFGELKSSSSRYIYKESKFAYSLPPSLTGFFYEEQTPIIILNHQLYFFSLRWFRQLLISVRVAFAYCLSSLFGIVPVQSELGIVYAISPLPRSSQRFHTFGWRKRLIVGNSIGFIEICI